MNVTPSPGIVFAVKPLLLGPEAHHNNVTSLSEAQTDDIAAEPEIYILATQASSENPQGLLNPSSPLGYLPAQSTVSTCSFTSSYPKKNNPDLQIISEASPRIVNKSIMAPCTGSSPLPNKKRLRDNYEALNKASTFLGTSISTRTMAPPQQPKAKRLKQERLLATKADALEDSGHIMGKQECPIIATFGSVLETGGRREPKILPSMQQPRVLSPRASGPKRKRAPTKRGMN